MHLAWQINDIRHSIFSCLEPQDLARLAQTCNAFFEVASNELWKTINGVSPFICCLPADCRRRPLQAEDVRRLDFYASKVQNLLLEANGAQKTIRLPPKFQIKKNKVKQRSEEQAKDSAYKSWEELWSDIAKVRPNTEFLLHLRRLRISNVVEELLIPLIGISGSNLTQLYIKYIHNRQPDSVIMKILNQLQDTPRLEYLFLRDGEDLVPSKLIQQSSLKHLRLDPRVHAARHEELQFKRNPLRCEILQKSTLEHLTLGLTREWYTPEIKAMQSKYLPALKTLWLNLTTFGPERCQQSCVNATAHSWTCDHSWHLDTDNATACGRQSPLVFFKGLDNPELNLLNIKFPIDADGTMFLDTVSAAKSSCRLENLTELALAGGGWFSNCDECGKLSEPIIQPHELREAMDMLLPIRRLKTLRLSVAPNFLDILDLELYKSITDGLPALEKLWLGNEMFCASSIFEGTTFYERVPLHHLAAFCTMLPNLVDVSVGAVDGMTLEERPRADWASPGVKTLVISSWAGSGVSRDLLHLGLQTYFPNSDLTKKEFPPRLYIFEQP